MGNEYQPRGSETDLWLRRVSMTVELHWLTDSIIYPPTASVSVVTVARICNSVGGVYWHATAVAVAISVDIKARVVNWKQVAVPTVLECANCSLHVTVGGAVSETVATVSLSTVPRLSLLSWQSCRLRVGKWTCGGWRAVSPTRLHSHRDQMTLPKWWAVFRKQRPEGLLRTL